MSRRKDPTGDYEVGYKRPPIATRFQPGHSAHPNRPKRRRTIGEELRAALMTKIKVAESGRPKVYTAQQIIIRNLVGEATRRNLRAVMAVFALDARYATSDDTVLDPADLPADDRAVLQGVINKVLGAAATAGQARFGEQARAEEVVRMREEDDSVG